MKEIGKRIWNEPAVALGALVTVALLVAGLLADTEWDALTISAVAAPLVTSLGIRPLVTPAAKAEEEKNAAVAAARLQR